MLSYFFKDFVLDLVWIKGRKGFKTTLELLIIVLSADKRELTLEEEEVFLFSLVFSFSLVSGCANKEAFEITEDFEWVFEGS